MKFLLAALFFISCVNYEPPGVDRATYELLVPKLLSNQKAVGLTLVLMDESGWGEFEALERFRQAQEVFLQCGITFSPVWLVKGVTGSYWVDTERVADFILPLVHPDPSLDDFDLPETTIIFAGRAKYDFGEGGVAWPQIELGMVFKFWDQNYPYSVLAHELGHILFKISGHPWNRGLMAPKEIRTNYILQCNQ